METALGTLPGIAWCVQVRSNDMYYDSNYWLGKGTWSVSYFSGFTLTARIFNAINKPIIFTGGIS